MREKVRATHGRGRGKLDMNLHFLCTSDPFATDVRSFSPPWSAAASTHRCCISEIRFGESPFGQLSILVGHDQRQVHPALAQELNRGDGRCRRPFRIASCHRFQAAQARHPVRGDAAERRLRTGATVQPRLPARNVQRLLRPLRHGDGQAAALRCGMPQGAPTLDEQAGSQAGPAVETGPGVEAAQVCYSRARPLPWAVRLHLRRAERRAVRDASLQIRAPDPTLGQDGGARRDLPHHVRSWPLNPGPRPSLSLALTTVLTPLLTTTTTTTTTTLPYHVLLGYL